MNNFVRQADKLITEGRGKIVMPPPMKDAEKYGYEKGSLYGFESWKEAIAWFNKLGIDDVVGEEVVIGETGEIAFDKGATRRSAFKKQAKADLKHKAEMAGLNYPILSQYRKNSEWWDDLNDFEDFYRILKKPADKFMGVDADEMRGLDYDVEFTAITAVGRKDGKPFTEEDTWNIAEFVEYYQDTVVPFNIKMQVFNNKVGRRGCTFGYYFA